MSSVNWITALRIFNEGHSSWCIPRKGTKDYERVAQIRKGDKMPTKREILESLEKKTRGTPAKKERKSVTIDL